MDADDKRLLRSVYEKVGVVYDAIPELRRIAEAHEARLNEHERRIIGVERLRLAHVGGHAPGSLTVREGEAVDPDHTPHGGIRIPPEGWERLTTEFRLNEARAEGAEQAVTKIKNSFKFWLGIASVVGPALAYVLTHFLHL